MTQRLRSSSVSRAVIRSHGIGLAVCLSIGGIAMGCTTSFAQERPDQQSLSEEKSQQLPIQIIIEPRAPKMRMKSSTQDERPIAKPLTGTEQNAIIESIIQHLNDEYVFPEVAQKVERSFRANLRHNAYLSFNEPVRFAQLLTDELQEIAHDKHLCVFYDNEARPIRTNAQEPSDLEKQEMFENSRQHNFGFERIERLPGNIGYLDLRNFVDHNLSAETATHAMSFLANTDALIIDLRRNGGGDPSTVQLLCSYLFEDDTVHLNDLYFRAGNETRQYWTLPQVPGKRYVNKEVYVLTSKKTFSGAEEFCYNLKNLKRATLVGERTGGGANPGDFVQINEHFAVFIPSGRAINPVTKTNWEGTGVQPDIEVPADQALLVAQKELLKKLLNMASSEKRKDSLKQELNSREKELDDMQQQVKE